MANKKITDLPVASALAGTELLEIVQPGDSVTGVSSKVTAQAIANTARTMVASGASHATGFVPDPPASSGTTKFLREDATWAVPASSGAPADAEYFVGSSNGTLSAERVATASTSITWNTSTAGQFAAERAALTGDVTASANSNATTIANNAVTFAKMADVATDRLIGRDTAGTGDPEALTVGGGIEFTGSGGIQTSAFTGDVTKTAGGTSLAIATGAVVTTKILDANVTFAKIQNIATNSLIGRDTASSGVPENILLNATLEMDGSGNLQRAALTGDVTATAGSNATTIATIAGAATAVEVNRVADVSARLIAAGSTLSVTETSHDGKTIKLDTLTGSVCTLPAATGSGVRFKFVVSVLATSNSHVVKVANASDIMQGAITLVDTDTAGTVTGFATAADSDTVTLNRSTTGSVIRGEWIEVEDIAANLWSVRGVLTNTGAGATPFSAGV